MCMIEQLALLLCGVIGSSCVIRDGEREKPVEITLRLSKQEIVPGEKVTLEAIIPSALDAKVLNVSYKAIRIGSFDSKLKKLVNYEPRFFVNTLNLPFDDLPMSIAFSRPMHFDVSNAKHKGTTREFSANRLGIFGSSE